MLRPAGLYGHMRRNDAKSGALLVLFFVLAWGLWLSLILLFNALTWWSPGVDLDQRAIQIMRHAWALASATWWIPVTVTVVWLGIAFFASSALIRMSTGARPLLRSENPKLYELVETLAIGAGLPTPRIEIMPSMQLNAYAAGLDPDHAVVAVSRGLLDELETDELAAVIAHELIHIRNRDVRLMVVASILAGALSILGATLFRRPRQESALDGDADFLLPAALFCGLIFLLTSVIGALALIGSIGTFALLTKFAISRSREFIADAGAVELTKNPDALIAALRKVSGRDAVPVTSGFVRAMLLSCDVHDWLDTHPSIDDRIEALKRHAGGIERPLTSKGGIRRFGRWGTKGYSGLSNGRSTPIRG